MTNTEIDDEGERIEDEDIGDMIDMSRDKEMDLFFI